MVMNEDGWKGRSDTNEQKDKCMVAWLASGSRGFLSVGSPSFVWGHVLLSMRERRLLEANWVTVQVYEVALFCRALC